MAKLHIETCYGIAPNDLLNDPEISLKAKGLFTYMQSKPDGWKFSADKINRQNKDGDDAVRSALRELEKFGYLERKPAQNGDGKWDGYDYFLYSKAKLPLGDFPSTDKPSTDKPSTENHITISKKESSKKELDKQDIELQSKSFAGKDVNDMIELFRPLNPNVDDFFKNKTERKAIEDMLKRFGIKKTSATIKALPKIVVQKCAPRITKPTELKRDLGKVLIFVEQQKINSKGKQIIGLT